MILALGLIFIATTIGLGVYSRMQPGEAHIETASETQMVEEEEAHMTEEEEATADEFNINHQRLRGEAFYLLPVAVGIGFIGARLAFSYSKESFN